MRRLVEDEHRILICSNSDCGWREAPVPAPRDEFEEQRSRRYLTEAKAAVAAIKADRAQPKPSTPNPHATTSPRREA